MKENLLSGKCSVAGITTPPATSGKSRITVTFEAPVRFPLSLPHNGTRETNPGVIDTFKVGEGPVRSTGFRFPTTFERL